MKFSVNYLKQKTQQHINLKRNNRKTIYSTRDPNPNNEYFKNSEGERIKTAESTKVIELKLGKVKGVI